MGVLFNEITIVIVEANQGIPSARLDDLKLHTIKNRKMCSDNNRMKFKQIATERTEWYEMM